MNAFESGKAAAFGIVDYIDAIPATFASDDNKEFWRGYLSGEYRRVQNGFRSEAEYRRATKAFAAALIATDRAAKGI